MDTASSVTPSVTFVWAAPRGPVEWGEIDGRPALQRAGRWLVHTFPPGVRVAGRLARLYPLLFRSDAREPEGRLGRAVLRLAEEFSPYAHSRSEGLTLESWASAIARAHSALLTAAKLEEEPLREVIAWVKAQRTAREWPPVHWPQVHAAIKDAASPREARLGLARYLFGMFGLGWQSDGMLGTISLIIPTGSTTPTLLAVKGAGEWAYLEAGNAIIRGRLRICPACGTPFTPHRADKLVCSTTCRQRKRRSTLPKPDPKSES